MTRHTGTIVAVVILAAASSPARADVIVPFTENFSANNANWFDQTGMAPVDWIAGGGPGGGGDAYVSTSFDFATANAGDPFALFRAQDEFNSSGGAFVGDWIAAGVTEFSMWVRHDAPVDIVFFTRFAGAANFPGANAIQFTPVAANTWTLITFAIAPDNPQFIFEGPASTFSSVFSAVGHIQVGINTPEGLAGGGTVIFDLDAVSIIPAPAAPVLLLAGFLVASGRRRRCRGRRPPDGPPIG